MARHSNKKKSKKTPRRASERKRRRTEKGSYYDEYFEQSTGIFIDPSIADRSVLNLSGEAVIVDGQNTDSSLKSLSNAEGEGELVNNTCASTPVEDQVDGGIELMLTRETPNVLSDHGCVTPVMRGMQTESLSSTSPTSGAESRRNSVNLMLELEQAQAEQLCADTHTNSSCLTFEHHSNTLPETLTKGTDDTVLLNNIYELHRQYEMKNNHQCCQHAMELEETVKEQVKTIESFMCKRAEQELKIEALSKELFLKEQKLKIVEDRVNQLENSNNYRKEVTRLEGVVEQEEAKLRASEEDLRRSKERNLQIQKDLEEEKQNKEKELKEGERRMQSIEVELQNKLKLIQDHEKIEVKMLEMGRKLEKKAKKMDELMVELNSTQEKVATLEENNAFLLNENVKLKNEAKVLKQRKKGVEDEGQINLLQEAEGANNTALRKELSSLKTELKRFQEFTFLKLDELAGRGGSSSVSSLSSTGSDDHESSAESEGFQLPKKKTLNRKKGERQQQIPQRLQYDARNPSTLQTSPDVPGRTLPVVPGNELYSERVQGSTVSPQSDPEAEERARRIEGIKARRQARESKTLIFSSSITRDITRQQRLFKEKYRKGDLAIHEFKGKRASEIVKYMIPHLEEEQPSSVVFVAGGNDLPNHHVDSVRIAKIAECLIEGGLKCRNEHGVRNVYISSIMPRENSQFQGNRHQLNKVLKNMCLQNGFTFIDNSNIVLSSHIHPDGVHLNYDGSGVLGDNLLHVLNG